jgi:EAL domain-containing protein (putative c-di-GMP-specific phosphodiesterase class I)
VRSIPNISKEHIDSYIQKFCLSNKKDGFLLFVEIEDLNLVSLLQGLNQSKMLVDNFFNYFQSLANSLGGNSIVHISLGGFLVILNDVDLKKVITFASMVNKYVHLDLNHNSQFIMSCNILSIEYKKDYTDPVTLLSKLFLRYSKGFSNYYINCDDSIDYIGVKTQNSQNLTLIRNAILQKTVEFAYQPIMSCKNGNVEYFEWLMRVPDENGQYISVGPIIPIAEESGFIHIIDQLVLTMAIEEIEKSDINLSINISNMGILNIEFVDLVKNLLSSKRNVAQKLIIEITETSFNYDYEQTSNFIKLIHDLGCRIALDDFGSGYTSFAQLCNLSIDIIKIDGSYIKNLETNNKNKIIVESLVKISNAIGAKTVAEFVESKSTADALMKLHIDGLQGNYFAPAILKKIPNSIRACIKSKKCYYLTK